MALDRFDRFMLMQPEEQDRMAANIAMTGATPPPVEMLPQIIRQMQEAQAQLSGKMPGGQQGPQAPQGSPGGGEGWRPPVPEGMPPAAPQPGGPQPIPPATPGDIQEGVQPIPPANPMPQLQQRDKRVQGNQYLAQMLGRR